MDFLDEKTKNTYLYLHNLLVKPSGPSESLEGELLRAIGNICHDYSENGGVVGNHTGACKFIKCYCELDDNEWNDLIDIYGYVKKGYIPNFPIDEQLKRIAYAIIKFVNSKKNEYTYAGNYNLEYFQEPDDIIDEEFEELDDFKECHEILPQINLNEFRIQIKEINKTELFTQLEVPYTYNVHQAQSANYISFLAIKGNKKTTNAFQLIRLKIPLCDNSIDINDISKYTTKNITFWKKNEDFYPIYINHDIDGYYVYVNPNISSKDLEGDFKLSGLFFIDPKGDYWYNISGKMYYYVNSKYLEKIQDIT